METPGALPILVMTASLSNLVEENVKIIPIWRGLDIGYG